MPEFQTLSTIVQHHNNHFAGISDNADQKLHKLITEAQGNPEAPITDENPFFQSYKVALEPIYQCV